MIFSTFAQDYLRWHYSEAFRQIFLVWSHFMWFVVYFFSLPQLALSWLSPWKRMTERRTRAWNFEDFLGTILINLMSRLVGGIIRTVFILIGFLALCTTVVMGIIFYLFWIIAPVFIVGCLGLGCSLIISQFAI
jgi:hypothetical protein